MRLFLAIDIPETIQDEINKLSCPGLEQVRWTHSHQLHITLLFLGEQPKHRLDEIIETISEIDFAPFPLELEQVGHFKSGIIWLGVNESEPLKRLQQSLCHKIRTLGIKLEQRKYIPHVTLGRCKTVSADILKPITAKALGFKACFSVKSFQIKSSVLQPDGAVYITEGTYFPDE